MATTFAYDGRGSRLQMSVAGETTTYLPDYGGRRNRILFEQGTAETKQYLYGVACLGEFVTDNATSDTEWRYYQRDGNSLVRQTTNQTATITLAWTFSPEGGVLLGEEGPVTHLGCGDDAVYDWSTGLIFKSGRYFDPNNGIWITMGGAVIWQRRQTSSRRKRRMSKRNRRLLLIFLLIILVLALTGCGDPTPEPTEDATCPPSTETPGLPTNTPPPTSTDPPPTSTDPPPTSTDPPPTSTDPPPTSTYPPPLPTPTPTPTPTPSPTPTPTIMVSSPVRTNGNLPDWIQWYGYTIYAKDYYTYSTKDKVHGGMDFGRYNHLFEAHNPAIEGSGVEVYVGAAGDNFNVLWAGKDDDNLGTVKIDLPGEYTGFYRHLDPNHLLVNTGGTAKVSEPIGYLEDTKMHVHFEIRNDSTVYNPLPFFEPGIRDTFANWNKEIENSERTRYDDKYEWPLDPGPGVTRKNWKDPLIQPETSY